jgi:hypothetical protein
MRKVRRWFDEQPRAKGSGSFRLLTDPCFVKLCDPVVDLDLGTAPVPGMVFPLALFDEVRRETTGSGPQRGNCISRRNVTRSLSSTYLVDMVKGGWLGTNTTEDVRKALADYCNQALAEGKSVTMGRTEKHERKARRHSEVDPAASFEQGPLF